MKKYISLIMIFTLIFTSLFSFYDYSVDNNNVSANPIALSTGARAILNSLVKIATPAGSISASDVILGASIAGLAGSYYDDFVSGLESAFEGASPLPDSPGWAKVTIGSLIALSGINYILDIYNYYTNGSVSDYVGSTYIPAPITNSPSRVTGVFSNIYDMSSPGIELTLDNIDGTTQFKDINLNISWLQQYYDEYGNPVESNRITQIFPSFRLIKSSSNYSLEFTCNSLYMNPVMDLGRSSGMFKLPFSLTLRNGAFHESHEGAGGWGAFGFLVDLVDADGKYLFNGLDTFIQNDLYDVYGPLDMDASQTSISYGYDTLISTDISSINPNLGIIPKINAHTGELEVVIPTSLIDLDTFNGQSFINEKFLENFVPSGSDFTPAGVPVGDGYIANPYFNPSLPVDAMLNPPTIWNPAFPASADVPYILNPAFDPSLPLTLENPVVIPNLTFNPDIDISIPKLFTQKFPFSLPFDFKYLLDLLIVEPERPKIDLKINSSFAGFPLQFDFYYDFEFMDNYINFVRWILIIGYGFTLIFLTSRIVGGAEN